MLKTTQNITVQAKLPIGQDTKAIATALGTLASELSEKELLAITNVVKNDPIKLSMAKSFLGLK